MEIAKLKRIALIRFSSGILVLGALFFLPAGTFRYWEAWVFLAVLFLPMTAVVAYLIRHDPELLRRRLQAREERAQQKVIQSLASVLCLASFLIPGFDHRFGWSTVPVVLVFVGNILVLTGYFLFFLVVRENSFASRIIQVEEDQTVITTGPYSLVRHPMYLGAGLMFIFAPIALGSYWAVLPMVIMPAVFALRIKDEEDALIEGLPGYSEYMQQTRWRLIPWVW